LSQPPSPLSIPSPSIMAEAIKRRSLAEDKIETTNDTHATNIDHVAEKKLLRKCDLRVLPPLFVLFLLAFLDRTNIGAASGSEKRLIWHTTNRYIGNAKIQGLTKDLDMEGPNASRYNIALFIFFIPYILFEVPSNLVLKKLAPSTWLSLIMVLWGMSTTSYLGTVLTADRYIDNRHGTRDQLRRPCCYAYPPRAF
jgi:hypothetical protein